MEHHDFIPLNQETLRQVFSLGPTGEFPDDKIDTNDKGELKFSVGLQQGRVVLNFGKPVTLIGFNVKSARRLSKLLAQRANEAAALARKK